ncbi:MAG: type V CRISPR-associated protein Cas12k [Myxacorys californica WJT36-NPBG1]|nr:type V CRISPR-associated protein Cas12k [Myxacorys californica WJT36-NPBG1]
MIVSMPPSGIVLTYSRSAILGKDYHLLTRQRQQQQHTSQLRHKAQKRNAPNPGGESELGQYVDRLIAKAVIAIAQTYHAGSIAVPKLGDVREIVQTEIQARAQQKCPGYLEGQKCYAKQYRVNVHRWSYGRLIESIGSQANKVGIVCEQGKQPRQGTAQEMAKEVAIDAYQSRK